MRIYFDPFERMLDDVVKKCAEKMNELQPQDLIFIPDVVYSIQTSEEGDQNEMVDLSLWRLRT